MLKRRSYMRLALALILLSSSTFLACNSQAHECEALIEEAREQFGKGDFRKNADLLAKATSLDPQNGKAWSRLCEAYQLTEELDLAVAACQKRIALGSSDIAFNSLGLVYLAKRDYANAATAFEKAAKGSKTSAIHHNFVWALIGAQQYEKAIPAAKRLIELGANDPPELKARQNALELLGIAYQGIGENDKAREAFRQAGFSSCSTELKDKELILTCKS